MPWQVFADKSIRTRMSALKRLTQCCLCSRRCFFLGFNLSMLSHLELSFCRRYIQHLSSLSSSICLYITLFNSVLRSNCSWEVAKKRIHHGKEWPRTSARGLPWRASVIMSTRETTSLKNITTSGPLFRRLLSPVSQARVYVSR